MYNSSQSMAESMGFVNFYGMSPWMNLLEDKQVRGTWAPITSAKQDINVLLNGCSDIRHFFKTVNDLCSAKLEKKNINVPGI